MSTERTTLREELTQDDVRARILAAAGELLDHDSFLLRVDANERAITHRLAMYLQAQFREWDVDCEYNRVGEDETKRIPDWQYIATQLQQQLAPRPVDLIQDTEGRTVYPDIIVHQRGTDQNLLVIEVKKSGRSTRADQMKLRLFRDGAGLGYLYGACLVLPVEVEYPSAADVELEFVE